MQFLLAVNLFLSYTNNFIELISVSVELSKRSPPTIMVQSCRDADASNCLPSKLQNKLLPS